MKDPITTILERITGYFVRNKIPYVVVGGVAVLILGRTRLTEDVDIIVNHKKLNRIEFINELKSEGFDANLSDLIGFDEKTHCSIFLKEGMFRIDIKGIYGEKEQESIDNAIKASFNGIEINIDHPESLILNKLIFGSEQDYEDALAVYIRNKECINNDKLMIKAKKYNIRNEMKQFINETQKFLNEKNN